MISEIQTHVIQGSAGGWESMCVKGLLKSALNNMRIRDTDHHANFTQHLNRNNPIKKLEVDLNRYFAKKRHTKWQQTHEKILNTNH